MKDSVFGDLPLWDSRHRTHMEKFMGSLIEGCKLTVQNKTFMKWLTDEKFDIAFAHMYHTCPIALIHAAKIPTWIWLLRMVVNKETAIMRKHWDPNFPDILDLASKCPLVMANSNELYEFPRPTLAKVVNIGGLGVEHKDAKPLKEQFKKIAETGKGMVVMSFGSVARTEWMPENWKIAILKAFARFPEYQFVIRYVMDDLKGRLPPNVHTFSWLPQNDLLLHPNTKAFISHGGYNSLQEAINSGVPLITIALFGDQFKNSKIAAKHGFAVNIKKGEISEETLYAAVKEVLENDKYSRSAKRLSLMVQKKPCQLEQSSMLFSTTP
ncbi:UDP-glucuronosyltransferase [Trichostrongylus colubriformis]|uniref:UDP-glucuronosyltransferase n=1 Tax=Trichostrongylus colubriformis TaxID=6319 RepID=A0AAN8IB70_TRICO